MADVARSTVQVGPASHWLVRYGLACAIVACASLLRQLADPLIHNQIPYFIYVAAVVVATWFCGFSGGVFSTILAAFVGNYLFVPPRYEFIPHAEDWTAMGMFAAVSFGLVALVGRWRRAETDVRRLHAEGETLLEQLRSATLAAEVGVWTWTPATNEVRVGANWRGLFGVGTDADVSFETWVNAIHPEDRDHAVASINAAWQDRHEFSAEYRVLHPDGTVRWLIDRGRTTHDASGNVTGMAGINVDITKRRAAEDALRDANRLKDEFLATLSHELRTPLNAILGWARILDAAPLDEKQQKRATEAIVRNAMAQTRLVEDVLDVSAIVNGRLRLNVDTVDLAAIVASAIDMVRPAADAKRIDIRPSFAPHAVMVGDGDRLRQVAWNLLSNAVKFSDKDATVDVKVERSQSELVLTVTDTGSGIDHSFLPHVFERFRQADSSTTRQYGGLGLGLAIVRHLVELHGGKVSAHSGGPYEGATFVVTLPIRAVVQSASDTPTFAKTDDEPTSVVSAPPLDEIRVLVVDDDVDARELVATTLAGLGAHVRTAATAGEAFDIVRQWLPDVLLSDIGMPIEDGYTLIRRIRQLTPQEGGGIPAAALTAYAQREDRALALSAGYQEHVPKPVAPERLAHIVRTLANRKSETKRDN